MSEQKTLGSNPFNNSSLFTDHYLHNSVPETEQWNCDVEAQEAFEDLKELWREEKQVVDSYQEKELQRNHENPAPESLKREQGTGAG